LSEGQGSTQIVEGGGPFGGNGLGYLGPSLPLG